MDKGVDRFAHFAVRKKERRGEGLSGSPKRLFSPRFIFDSVARRPSRIPEIRGSLAFLLLLETRVGISCRDRNEIARYVVLTTRPLSIVGHALKNFTFTELVRAGIKRIFLAARNYFGIVSVSMREIVPLFSFYRFCLVVCFLSSGR